MSKRQTRIRTDAGGPDMGTLIEPRFFKALCDPNRVAILVRLAQCGRPCTVTEVSACCPVNISVVSRHLAQLRDAGILDAQKRGKEVYYRVRYTDVVGTLRALADAIDHCCPTDEISATACCPSPDSAPLEITLESNASSKPGKQKARRKREHPGKRP